MEVKRVSPEEVRRKVQAGEVLLVCGYEDEEKFKAFRLEGAISFSALRTRLPSLAKTQEIVFYCA